MPNNSNIYPENFFLSSALFKVIYLENLLTAPTVTTNAIYEIGGVLYFNGSPVGGGSSIWELVGGTGPDIYYTAGNVGIGTNSPNYTLEVVGSVKLDGSTILPNNTSILFQDNVGGLTAFIQRNTDNTLTIENSTTDKDLYLNTTGTGSTIVSYFKVNNSISILESGATPSFYTIISAANQSADISYVLPSAQGGSGTYLKNDGSGNLSWGAGSSVAALSDLTDVLISSVTDKQFLVYDSGVGKWVNYYNQTYAGFISYTAPTTNPDGTLTIGSEDVVLFDNADKSGRAERYTLAGGTTGTDFPAIPENTTTYIVGDYNTGSPIFNVITDVTLINDSNVVPYVTVYRTGTTTYYVGWDETGAGLANKLEDRFVKTNRYQWESGLDLSETVGRVLHISGGKVWHGAVRQTTSIWDSVSNICRFWYHSGGTWTNSVVTTYNNSQYDDGTNLQLLGGNKYGVVWIYKSLAENGNVGGYVLGRAAYTHIAEAMAEPMPSMTSLPPVIAALGIFVGRIIMQNGASTAIRIDSAFVSEFASSSTSHHWLSDLTNYDDHTQYALLLGRAGGQTLIGGINAGDDLTLQSTSNGTKGSIFIGTSEYDEVNNRLGIGITSPTQKLDVSGNARILGDLLLLEDGGGTDLLTITTASLGNARTYTIPDAGGAATFIVSTSTPVQGDILYYSGTTWVSLVAGTNRYLLETGGPAANPSWGLNPVLTTYEPTGFANTTDSTISISTRMFTIEPSVTSYDVYIQNVKYNKTSSEQIEIPDIAGQLNYIYFNSSGVLTQNVSVPHLGQNAIIATVYWDGTTALLCEERHGTTMDWATHYYLHHHIGTVWSSGLDGSFSNDGTFSINPGEIDDEDLVTTVSGSQTTCRVLYRSSLISSKFTFTSIQASWFITSGGIIAYDNSGTLDPLPENYYMSYWIFASPDINCTIYSIAGQSTDTTLYNARTNQTFESLDLATLPNNEMKLIYRVIVQNIGGSPFVVATDDYRTISNRTATISHSALSNLMNDDHLQYLKHDRISDAQGQIIYHNGTNWVSLSAGTNGYYLKTQGPGANPKWDFPTIGNLTELTSSVLTITGGTNAVWGAGVTIQVIKADSTHSGYLLNTDWSSFNSKYNGLPSQTGNAGKYLTTNGVTESWATVASTSVAGYTAQGFSGQTSVTVAHNFGAYPVVQVLDSSNVQLIPLDVTHTNTNQFTVTFSESTTGTILASVGSPYIQNIVAKTIDYTLQSSDTVVLGNAEITLTLPTAVGIEGKTYTIKNITSADLVTVQADGVETIDGANTFLVPAKAAVGLVSDGAGWWVI